MAKPDGVYPGPGCRANGDGEMAQTKPALTKAARKAASSAAPAEL